MKWKLGYTQGIGDIFLNSGRHFDESRAATSSLQIVQYMKNTAPSKKKSAETTLAEKQLYELLEIFTEVAEAKGWSWKLDAKDEKKSRYASVSVNRYMSNEYVTAIFEINCDSKVSLSGSKTSFYDYGITDLRAAAWREICKLPWLVQTPANKDSHNFSSANLIERLLRRFHRIARRLKHRYDDRSPLHIEDEYDVQDLLHGILCGLFDDVRSEEHTPSYAGASSRVDFLLKAEKIAIEAKFTSKTLKDKQIGEQLLIDIGRYRSHPDCKSLICFVYDPGGHLKNPNGLEADLSKTHDSLDVKVIVVSPDA